MASIRMSEAMHQATLHHLFDKDGEHFVFFLARWTYSQGEPVFLVYDAIFISDEKIELARDGYVVSVNAIINVINQAVKSGACLIEAHNHGGELPRFSWTDRVGFREFPPYILSSLPERPYAATVWGDETVYGEYFLPNGETGLIRSITTIGSQLHQIVSRDDDEISISSTYDRQLPWFTESGQRQLERLRIGIIGCGGTGSHIIQNLAYLGAMDFILIDEDVVDETSMNRLVTATAADIDTPKVILGRRLIKSVAPSTSVRTIHDSLRSQVALDALKDVDVLFGCVDNDGARHILNELAVAYQIPYFDIATGIDAEGGKVATAGGRVAVVLPNGPCLHCIREINTHEVRHFLASKRDQADEIARGYITGVDVPNPSVVSLNALVSSMAISEFAVLISGLRPVNLYAEYDLLGVGRAVKSQYISPRKIIQDDECLTCAYAGKGDEIGLERYTNKSGKEKHYE